ncbi:MAG: flagellar biosynthesis protein FlhF [Ignavibacteria bacterium]|jgi:flagellar biosynthesis protein FlhF|nr:flagellar biosynthesis protein FlhF [Ignavibacteria bacterium]
MRIKKFIASNMQEGKELIARELGDEAIILSNRTTKLANGASAVEIVAALDQKNVLNTNKPNPYTKSNVLSPSKPTASPTTANVVADGFSNEINKRLITEVSSLKDMLADISDSIKYKYTGTMPPALSRLYKILIDSEIGEELALELIGRVASKGVSGDFNQALEQARNYILKRITFSNPIAKLEKRQVITFVGATGCGKTTSLIKLAIVCKLLHKARILIVSTDTHKVGGLEQIQTLASIAGMAFQAAYSPEELANIVKEEDKYDIIMIDTVGKNPNNAEELASIKAFQDAANPTLSFLVLSAITSESSLLNMLNRFKKFDIHSAIVTKVDEANGLGNIISCLHKRQMPLAYFTTGQNIPDDIQPADNEVLNDYLFVV